MSEGCAGGWAGQVIDENGKQILTTRVFGADGSVIDDPITINNQPGIAERI